MFKHHGVGLRRSFNALRHFFASEVGHHAAGWFGLLLALLIATNALNVFCSYVGRDFVTAIAHRRPEQYTTLALLYLMVFLGLTILVVFSRFSEERLRLLWRVWLTRVLIDGYLSNYTYYRLNAREDIDNPDQRITDDVKSFTQTTLSFFILSLNSTISSLALFAVLWSITPLLVVVAIAYAVVGTSGTVLLGRPLMRLNGLQLKKEADLRFDVMEVREVSQAIALLGIEKTVRGRLAARLANVVEGSLAIIGVTRNLGFFTQGYTLLINLVPLLIVAPMYLRGTVEFGVVTQAATAFAQVLGALSLIVTQFEMLSTFAAVTDRLNATSHAIELARTPAPSTIDIVEDDECVAYDKLTLWTPKEHHVLVRELCLSLPRGNRLLITGPNETAKEALFVATAGLWDDGEGRIIRPNRNLIHFAPPQPLAIRSTLRERILITVPELEFSDEQIIQSLHRVGLEEMLERIGGLHVEHDWSSALSQGEQHLVAVARLLLSRPHFAFLNHAADALDPRQVELLYRALSEASITYFSIGEDDRLEVYHDTTLQLFDDGRWESRSTRDVAVK